MRSVGRCRDGDVTLDLAFGEKRQQLLRAASDVAIEQARVCRQDLTANAVSCVSKTAA